MLDFGVSHEQHERLRKIMTDNNIEEHDLDETYSYDEASHSHNTNKAETCVHLHHRPTGTKVKYHHYKQKGLNRYWARVQMIEMIYKGRSQEYVHEFSEEDVLEQARKHAQSHQDKQVSDKKHHSEIKKNRHKLHEHEIDGGDLEEADIK